MLQMPTRCWRFTLSNGHRWITAPWFVATMLAHTALPGAAAAQSPWELTPYQVHVRLAVENSPWLSTSQHPALASGLAAQLETTVGAAWELDVALAAGPTRHALLRDLAALDVDDAPTEFLTADKFFAVSITTHLDTFQITTREFDCRTRGWGPVLTRGVPQRQMLEPALARILLSVFRPMARIDVHRDESVTLRLRASGLPARDPRWKPVVPGGVFEPILRRNDREGSPLEDGIQPVAWTYLVVVDIADGDPQCKVISGLRSGLSMRRRARTELVALATTPIARPTTVQLRSRADESRPLVGYEIYTPVGATGEMIRLGRSDDAGQFELPPRDEPVVTLYIKHGGEVLGRLPVVPGLKPVVTARLVDDDVRLAVEAELFGLEQDLIDTVARREVLLARTRSRLDAGNLAGAERMLSELKRLPTRTQFSQQLGQLRNKSGASDPAVQAQVEGLLRKTEQMLGKYLDPAAITQVQTLYNQATAAP